MYIAPNSDIKILSGVPLDNTYEHTISWEQTPTARYKQEAYFMSKVKFSFSNQYYQRVKRGWLKIQCNPDDLYNCNYLMFKNKSFGSKWFYAFILSIEYVNNETAQVNYEIDVMQTWLRGIGLDYKMSSCFVERQHTTSDNMYENLVPEEISNAGGEYVVDNEEEFDMNTMKILIYSSVEKVGDSWVAASSVIKNNVFGGVCVYSFPTTQAGVQEAGNLIKEIASKTNIDNVVAVRMAPVKFEIEHPTVQGTRPTEYTVKITKPTYVGGKNSKYYPKNNKIFSYPFSKIMVSNLYGQSEEYLWESFTDKDTRGSFTVTGCFSWNPEVIAYPNNYRGIAKPIEFGVLFNAFPVCCWNGDAYKAWWAQNTVKLITGFVGDIASPLVQTNGLTATSTPLAVAGAVGGTVNAIGNVINSVVDSQFISNSAKGKTDCSGLMPALDAIKFRFTTESYRYQDIKRYDRYFTKFGYAIKDIIVPGYRNRKRWTYVKTVNSNIESTLNNEDSQKICSIYDAGITFWVNPDEIGDYSLDNEPV